jgi:hypothetical protein
MPKSSVCRSWLALGLWVAAGCGGLVNLDAIGGGGSATAGASAGGSVHAGGMTATTAGQGTGGQGTGGVTPCPGLPYDPSISFGGACTGVGTSIDPSPPDLYVLLDRSQSMDTATANGQSTRWRDATAAIEQFLSELRNSPVHAGIQFFGLTGGTDSAADCNASSYATPAVGIGSPDTSGPQVSAAMAAVTPSGETPSVPALQGAIQHAWDWQFAHPDRETRVVFVTDGMPTACADQSDASWLAAAQAGMALDPPIRTYVFGLAVGGDAYRLNALARSGGTVEAALIEDSDLPSGLAAALAAMASSYPANPGPCEFQIPPQPDPLLSIDYGLTRVIADVAGGGPEELPYAASLAGCYATYGGWYYDVLPDLEPPSKVILCPCSCAGMNSGSLDLYFGCRILMHPSP